MPKVSVSERALRELLKQALESRELNVPTKVGAEKNPVEVNNNVDPSAAVTQPDDADFLPQNRKEMQIAVRQQLDRVADDDASTVYAAVKKTIDKTMDVDAAEHDKKEAEDKSNRRLESMNHSLRDKVTENIVRKQIRRILIEAGYESLGFSGWPQRDDDESDDDDDDEKPHKKIASMVDVGGDVLNKIADEFGRSTSGAKRMLDVTENTAKFLGSLLSREDTVLEDIQFVALEHFVDALAAQGELDQEDVAYMNEHPEEVAEMESYRIYLSEYVKSAMKKAVGDFLESRMGEVEDYFAEMYPQDPEKAQKYVQQVAKNPQWEVPRLPMFYEFVEDAFELDVGTLEPPKHSIDKLIDQYMKAEKGRSGGESEGEPGAE